MQGILSQTYTNSSQRHKHVQFIPLPPREEFTPFPDTVDKTTSDHDATLPFQHFFSDLPLDKTSASLYNTYATLCSKAQQSKDTKISYNFVMTTEWMFISPRIKEDYVDQGYTIGVNSTGMVGLLLTKSEQESAFVENIGPITILAHVGKPWPQATS